ncbi:MAG TPA: chemotaxis protein CheB, partial [Gemmatimonadales bacterium]|nr:chemotaxis protein CheB [Gemmatimonadales bacterium]
MNIRPKPSLDVLVIDDSAVVRQALTLILTREPRVIVTVAADPLIAMEKMRRHTPDVIILDLDLPRMDGLTFLERLMAEHPVPVVVCSGLAGPNTAMALRALELGAVTVIAKPEQAVGPFLHNQAKDLITTVRNAAEVRVRRRSSGPSLRPVPEPIAHTSDPFLVVPGPPDTVLHPVGIGASMGGVEAVTKVLSALPEGAPPILVVQHMPAGFTAAFARRLAELCRIDVAEARHGDAVVPGRALIAPGDRHLTLSREG